MRTSGHPSCPNCGADGALRHTALQDHLFGTPGRWSMRECGAGACGAFWLDPAPIPDDLSLAYRDYYTHAPADRAAGRHSLVAAVRAAFLARRLGYAAPPQSLAARALAWLAGGTERSQAWLYEYFYLPARPGARLLEIGCGSGRQLLAMRDAGWEVQGIDFDPAAVAAARSAGLDVEVGDLRDLGLASARFDAVVMAHVIEHVFDPVGLLKECARLLKPGGTLVSITPNGASLGHRRFRDAWRGLEPPRHLVVFTPRALALAATRGGLGDARVHVTARDAANMLLASARLASAADGERVDAPRRGDRMPLRHRAVALLERIGDALGLAWGEELVLIARNR